MGKPYPWYQENMNLAANPVEPAQRREPFEGRPSEQSLGPSLVVARGRLLERVSVVLRGPDRKSSRRETRSKCLARPCSISHYRTACLYRFSKTESCWIPALPAISSMSPSGYLGSITVSASSK